MPEKYKNKYRIPSARLQGYDYGQNGAYFITICTKNRNHYFGEIVSTPGSETQHDPGSETQHDPGSETQHDPGSETQHIASLRATRMGTVANEYWRKIPEHFPFVLLDEFIVMPNHIHGILVISKETGDYVSGTEIGYANKFGPQSGNISSVIRGFKAAVTAFATTNEIEFGWQPRFHDRVIRNDEEMKRIINYIAENPGNWVRDRNNKEDIFM